MKARILTIVAVSMMLPLSLVMADERDSVNEIRKSLQQRDFDKAQELFDKANEDYPSSRSLKAMHGLFYSYLSRAKKYEQAAKHADANLDYWLEMLEQGSNVARTVANVTRQVATAHKNNGQPDVAVKRLTRAIDALKELEDAEPETVGLIAELRGQHAMLVGEDDAAQGKELLDSLTAEVKTALEANSDDLGRVLAVAGVLKVRAQAAETVEETATASAEHAEFLRVQTDKHADNYTLASGYYLAALSSLRSTMYTDAAQAADDIAAFEAWLTSLDSENARLQQLVKNAARSLSSIKSGIEQQKLVGQPGFPLDAQAWVNGEPLAETDLKGKVVLLDFWAVWCGPCIATFPHLREWQEKYSDRGLVIIGATKYYEYDWNNEAQRIKKTKGLSAEDEEAAMVRFAKHHKLQHRFMVSPKGSGFSKLYKVRGIPTAVLLDQEGTIRMIRVGSGSANAHALEEMIEKLLESPAAAG